VRSSDQVVDSFEMKDIKPSSLRIRRTGWRLAAISMLLHGPCRAMTSRNRRFEELSAARDVVLDEKITH
jgi:hypothetical protein